MLGPPDAYVANIGKPLSCSAAKNSSHFLKGRQISLLKKHGTAFDERYAWD
jgi:hypothetical protein